MKNLAKRSFAKVCAKENKEFRLTKAQTKVRKSCLRNQKRTSTQSGACFFLVADFVGQGLNLPPTARDRPPLAASRANNLQTSENTSVKCFREGLTAQSAVERAESSAWREETPMRLLRTVVGSTSCALSKNIVAPSGEARLRPLTVLFGGRFFSYINDKSAFACPTKTEVADLYRSRVQSFRY